MKRILIAFVLLIALVGVALAGSATPTPTSADQQISAKPQPYTITLTAPGDITDWTLTRGVNNERDIGPVYISTTAPSSYHIKLEVSSNSDRLTLTPGDPTAGMDNPMYISAVTPPVPDPSGWTQLTTGVYLTKLETASTTPVGIPIRIRQYVSPDDPDGDYSIRFTYTLSVVPPS